MYRHGLQIEERPKSAVVVIVEIVNSARIPRVCDYRGEFRFFFPLEREKLNLALELNLPK